VAAVCAGGGEAMRKFYPKALLTVLENLFRGRDPQQELPWTPADWIALILLGAVLAAVIGFSG
jgi:hypothetical protein